VICLEEKVEFNRQSCLLTNHATQETFNLTELYPKSYRKVEKTLALCFKFFLRDAVNNLISGYNDWVKTTYHWRESLHISVLLASTLDE